MGVFLETQCPGCGGGGGSTGFQVTARDHNDLFMTGMIERGQKSKPKKIHRASNKNPKNPMPKEKAGR